MSTRDLHGKGQAAASHTGQALSQPVRMYQAPVPPPTFSKAQSTVAASPSEPKDQASKAAAAAQVVSLTSKQVQADNVTWQCCFCHSSNSPSGVHDLRSCPELRSESVDYLEQDMSHQPVSQSAETIALLVDVTADEHSMSSLKSLLTEVVQHLPRAWRLMLLTFGSSVAIYQLASKGVITADVVSGHWQASSKQDSSPGLPFGSAEPLHIASLQSCQEQAVAIINSWRSTARAGPSREQPRCLGAALGVALHLMAATPNSSSTDLYGTNALPAPQRQAPSRILLVTTGPATQGLAWLQGPGRVPLANLDNRQGPEDLQASKEAAVFFKGFTQQAALAGTAVDVLAVGQAAVNVPLLGSLTQRAGGLMMAHQRFEEASGQGLAVALRRRQGVEGFLDIHTSSGLGVTHVTGPVTPLDRSKLGSNSTQRHSRPTMNAHEMVSVETGQGIAVGLDVTRDLPGDYAYMQVIISWRSLHGGWMQRVATQRLSATGSLQAVLSGTDWGLAAVLAGKAWIAQAQAKNAAQDRRAAVSLQKQIGQHVSQLVSQAAGGQSAWGAFSWIAPPPPAILPPYLHNFVQVMYQLQRGPMLGQVAGHSDERALLHTCFLAADAPVALLMMASVLHVFIPAAAAFQATPALDLAIHTGEAMVLDCGNQIFTSIGGSSTQESASTADSAQPTMQRLLQQLVYARVPAPGILRIDKDSPDMRYITARLMPTWKNSVEEQQQQYPALLNWQPDQFAAAQQGRIPTDEPSFNQWARSLGINPTGAVDNLMAAMQTMSVSNLAADSGRTQSDTQPVETSQPVSAEV